MAIASDILRDEIKDLAAVASIALNRAHEVSVMAGFSVTALHNWPGATGKRSYLAWPHMHDFSISVRADVSHDDRDIEFHDLRDMLKVVVHGILRESDDDTHPASFGAQSCETIGRRILDQMPLVDEVHVDEDGFCGATVRRSAAPTYAVPKTTLASKIVTVCGSTKFKRQAEHVIKSLTDMGWVVLFVEFFSQVEGVDLTDEVKVKLDELHLHKIRLSDAIYVVNPDGYVGESTRREIQFAKDHNIPITWMQLA